MCNCFSQVDLWSDVSLLWLGFGSSWHLVMLLVRLTLGQMHPPAETSCGQVCYYFSQADLWSDYPPQLGFGSGWHLVMLLVRLTFGQMHPPAETCGGQVYCYFCQVDLWSDVAPWQTSGGHVCYYLCSVWPLVRCTPLEWGFSQVDISSDFVSGWSLFFFCFLFP